MRFRSLSLARVTLACGVIPVACAQIPPRLTSDTAIAITDVTVIDVVTGELRSGMTVVTEDDRIASVSTNPPIPPGARRVNGRGKFVIPGLWDMHAHHQGTGEGAMDLFVAKGVTGTRDMGGDLDFILPLRDRVRSRALLGPEIITSGPILDNSPNFPYRWQVSDGEQAQQAVAKLKKAGVDFIKVHDSTPREAFFAIAKEAARLGLRFEGHVPNEVKIEEAVASGISSIEHLANFRVFDECITNNEYSLPTCKGLFRKLAESKVWQTPTLEFFLSIPDTFSGQPIRHADYASDPLLELQRKNVEHSKVPARALERMRAAGRTALVAIRDMHAMGVQFLAGCDSAVPGFCLHDELEWFTKAGLNPLQALQTATVNPARFLGRERTQGTVEAGKRADLVLLEANPLSDIRNISRITEVVVRGQLLTGEILERIVSHHRRTQRP